LGGKATIQQTVRDEEDDGDNHAVIRHRRSTPYTTQEGKAYLESKEENPPNSYQSKTRSGDWRDIAGSSLFLIFLKGASIESNTSLGGEDAQTD